MSSKRCIKARSTTARPRSGSGTPTTAASATSSSEVSASSMGPGRNFRPPERQTPTMIVLIGTSVLGAFITRRFRIDTTGKDLDSIYNEEDVNSPESA